MRLQIGCVNHDGLRICALDGKTFHHPAKHAHNTPTGLSPDQHEAIWEIQKTLDFPGFVYGVDRSAPDVMKTITSGLSDALGVHRSESGC
nr:MULTISPECIES: hypothetical protein [Agrobacterium tumefaciens complex]